MQHPKLRDGKNRKGCEPYPLGEIPQENIVELCKWLVFTFAIGKSDISGEDWGDIFAKSIDGDHLDSPVGLADVVLDGHSWSVKTVKNPKTHTCPKVRVISGRNSPDYSYNIKNPHEDIQKTGSAILNIWNERVNIARDQFDSLRIAVLIRDITRLAFTIFEVEAQKYIPNNYRWEKNKRGNFEGIDISTGTHKFTWQPHGSQFTVIYEVPHSSKKFSIKRPKMIDFKKTIEDIGFNESWIEFV